MKRVFICSPLSAPTPELVQKNIQTALDMCAMASELGYAPFAPHCLYTQYMDDEMPYTRERAIQSGLSFLKVCHELWYLAGKVSSGMQRELDFANHLNIPTRAVSLKEIKRCLEDRETDSV